MTTRTLLLALPLVLAGWIGTLAAVMLVAEAPGAVALFPGTHLIERLPEGAAVVARGRFHVTVDGGGPGLAAALYSAGALLVLPSGLSGCLPG